MKPLRFVIFLLGICIFLLSSCTSFSYYYPQKGFQPLLTQRGDLQLEAGTVGTPHFKGWQGSAAFAPGKHSFVFFNADLGRGNSMHENVNTDSSGIAVKRNLRVDYRFSNFRAGGGYYGNISKFLTWGAVASLSSGAIQYQSFDTDHGNVKNAERAVYFNTISLGPYICIHNKYLYASLIPNYTIMSVRRLTNDAAIAKNIEYEDDMDHIHKQGAYGFIQPTLQIGLGSSHFKLFAAYTICNATTNPIFTYEDRNIGFGFTATFGILPLHQ